MKERRSGPIVAVIAVAATLVGFFFLGRRGQTAGGPQPGDPQLRAVGEPTII